MKQSWHYRYFVPNVEISGDCPSISICGICEQKHVTNSCPSLPGLKAVYQGANEETEQICFIGQRRPWKPRPPGMVQDPSSFYSAFWTNQKNWKYPSQNWYPPMPWQQWAPQKTQSHHWQQGWRGPLETYNSQPHKILNSINNSSNCPSSNYSCFRITLHQDHNFLLNPAIKNLAHLQCELTSYPTYFLSPIDCPDIYMRSGKIFHNITSPII